MRRRHLLRCFIRVELVASFCSGKPAFDPFPLTPLESNPSIGQSLGPVDKVIDGKDVLGFEAIVANAVLGTFRMGLDHAVQPVLYSVLAR